MKGLPSAGTFDLVIFDHDGVLVDSEIIAMDLCASLLTEHGVPTTVDEAIDGYLGGSLDAVMDAIESTGAVINRQAFDTRFHDELFDGFRHQLQAIPGIRTLLEPLLAMTNGMPAALNCSRRVRIPGIGLSSRRNPSNSSS